jgi:hypothetical protein
VKTRGAGLALVVGLLSLAAAASASDPARFATGFEPGLAGWDLRGPAGAVTTRPDGGGRVMVLSPAGDEVLALLPATAAWPGVRLSGRLRFPADDDPYLGFVYHFAEAGGRQDFGVVYVKGEASGSYLQANPHRDRNVSRLLYPERRAALTDAAAVPIGAWQTFALEVVGRAAHVYIGPGREPQLTFNLFEGERGAVGLQPRSVGGDVWVDDVEAVPIDRLSWSGPPRPAVVAYAPAELLTRWQVAGPFERTRDEFGHSPARQRGEWREFAVDSRGAVVTGRVVETHGARSVAYFRTVVPAATAREAALHVSSIDDLALWVGGRFRGFYARGGPAWWDFFREPAHAGRRIPIELDQGDTDVVLRVRGGVYASGGFFARIEPR